MTVFFTADHHFGHTNIIRHVKRPFASVQEMNETLIKNWNSVISPSDTVYHLGDVSVLRPERTKEILDRLNGKIFLIRGNHDAAAEHRLCRDRFEWIKDYHFASFNGGIRIALCHYAMRVWDRKHYGSYHLYGHSHGLLPPLPGEFSLKQDFSGQWFSKTEYLQGITTENVQGFIAVALKKLDAELEEQRDE